MNAIQKLGNWLESLSKPKDNIEKIRLDIGLFCDRYEKDAAKEYATLRGEVNAKLSDISGRMGVIESSTASRISVEEALNVLDKKIAALMVANSFPSYSSVPQDDPLQIIARK